mgnify:FL=1
MHSIQCSVSFYTFVNAIKTDLLNEKNRIVSTCKPIHNNKEQSNYLDHSLLITSMIIISVPTSPPQPEKYKTSDNPSRVHSKESGDQEPADALRFDAAEPLHPLRHCEASYGKAHRS